MAETPLLLVDGGEGVPERFADADALARRVHQLRQGAGLNVTAAHASIDGAGEFPGVFIWRRAKGRRDAFLAFAAGQGVATPAELLEALRRCLPGRKAA